MAKSDNGIACCGHHLECQQKGICVNDLFGTQYPRCSLKERVIDYPFPTLYKLKELGLVEAESCKLTQKGIDYIKPRLNMNDPMLVLLTLLVLDGSQPRTIKPKFLKLRGLLRNENLCNNRVDRV